MIGIAVTCLEGAFAVATGETGIIGFVCCCDEGVVGVVEEASSD
jgi:hypothetical protein